MENLLIYYCSKFRCIYRAVQMYNFYPKFFIFRQDCFQLLKEICSVLPGALGAHIGELIPGILYSLSEKNASSNMKIDSLSFIYCLLTTHSPTVFHPYISTLLQPVIIAVGDNFYKIAAEALGVLQELVKVIRPMQVSICFIMSILYYKPCCFF